MTDESFERLVEQNARAEAAARAALAAHADDPNTLRALARLYDGMGRFERALQLSTRAVTLDDSAQSHFQHAIILQHLGDFPAALAAYRRTTALDPLIARAHLEIVQLSEAASAAALAPMLTALFERVRDHPVQSMFVGHALAKIAEDAGDLPASFAWLQRAKAALRSEARYDHAAATSAHEAAVCIGGHDGFASEEPIFVVGLPRTGTTLLDRILSSHAEVASAGELPQLLLLTNALAGAEAAQPIGAAVLHAAGRLDFPRLGKGYVESTRPATGVTPRFIDKAPMNYLLAGVAQRALPQARMICLRRDPMDACLSMYRQVLPVRTGQYDFAYDIEDTARQAALFELLLARWRDTLAPDRFTVLDYEKLVNGLEGETRRLLEFCGLPWDPRCLRFHENTAPVATPSAAQVRQPIYASSVGRWRRYGGLAEPALRILQAEGVV